MCYFYLTKLFSFSVKALAILFIAVLWVLSNKWVYISVVLLILECPKALLMSKILTPKLFATLAKECLKSCNLTGGKLLLSIIFFARFVCF